MVLEEFKKILVEKLEAARTMYKLILVNIGLRNVPTERQKDYWKAKNTHSGLQKNFDWLRRVKQRMSSIWFIAGLILIWKLIKGSHRTKKNLRTR